MYFFLFFFKRIKQQISHMEKVGINLHESPSHSKNALKRDKSIYISILIHPSQSVGQQSEQGNSFLAVPHCHLYLIQGTSRCF